MGVLRTKRSWDILVQLFLFVVCLWISTTSPKSGSIAVWVKAAESDENHDSSASSLKTLFEATRQNNVEAIRNAVLKRHENINEIGPGGQTPVVMATLLGLAQAVKTLVDLGANLEIPEKDGYTVAHAAGFQGRADVLRVLLEHTNVDPNIPHADGYYPLHRACWGREPRHAETVHVFLQDGGVDPQLVAQNGKTCLEMTRNEATIQVLQEAIAAKQEAEETVDSASSSIPDL